MIIPMKQVTLLCLEQDKTIALESLRELGVMQLIPGSCPESHSVASLSRQSGTARKVLDFLSTVKPAKHHSHALSNLSGHELIRRASDLLERAAVLEKGVESLRRDEELLHPWGAFSSEQIRILEDKRLYVRPCITSKKIFDTLSWDADVAVCEITRVGAFVHYALIFHAEPDDAMFDVVSLPEKSLSRIREELQIAQSEIHAIRNELAELAAKQDAILAQAEEINASLEFVLAREGMASANEIAYLHGYVPVSEIDALRDTAKASGWALKIEDPAPDDETVPTYIKKPRFLDVMDPLFDFIGISPGYRENDVNVFFLLFFPIFFAMIIGDAGYALLFTAVTIPCKFIFRGKRMAQLFCNLMLLLSAYTFIWGFLNGAWCGIPRDVLPDWMRGVNFLADPQNSPAAHRFCDWVGYHGDMGAFRNKFIQFLCFVIASIHLTSARVFKFFDDIRRSWRAFGHLGWAVLLIMNGLLAIHLIVFPGVFPAWGVYAYLAGALAVIVTISGQEALNLPFSLMGSFVDVLSYIRLFAVGLAGVYISEKFVEMGLGMTHSTSVFLSILGVVVMILVALFGNVLNIALGFLGVLVHAIRLNTLEFSNHIGMQWAGTRFRPFQKLKQAQQDKSNITTGVES